MRLLSSRFDIIKGLLICLFIVISYMIFIVHDNSFIYSHIQLNSFIYEFNDESEINPIFYKRPEVADLECKRLFNGKILPEERKKKRKILNNLNLNMSCEAIRSRILPARNPNTGFPIAYARIVHTEYEFLEEQLSITYSNENWYCFATDSKSSVSFRRNIVILSSCLPNVILANDDYDSDSAGHNHNNAHFDCLHRLKEKYWNYIIFLQNFDIMIKSNNEMVEIFKTLNGANDIKLYKCPGSRCRYMNNSMEELGLCPINLTKDEYEICRKSKVTFAKGSVQMSLSRVTSLYIMNDLNTTNFRNILNKGRYGVDEMFIQTLMVNDQLKVPGSYPLRCLKTSLRDHTRLSSWSFLKSHCGSKRWRHSLCVYGIEDLPFLASSDYIMANKMIPSMDYGAISCIGELLYNRTWLNNNDHPLNLSVYQNYPLVRLKELYSLNPNALQEFECPKPPTTTVVPRTRTTSHQLVS